MTSRSEIAIKALYRWSVAAAAPLNATLEPICHRVWPRAHSHAPAMTDLCFFGEDVATAFLREHGHAPDAGRLGGVLPIDILSSQYAVEVKAGTLSNSPNAQHWRLTFSAARGSEQVQIDQMTAEGRRLYWASKKARILSRKEALLEDLCLVTKREILPATVTMIVDAARMDVDVFWFDGFHHRIGWSSRQAEAGFRGSFHVTWAGRK